MTDDRSIERAARSWLEIGPTEAPERAVEAALVQIESTPQERDWLPWRLPKMTTPARVAAAVVVGVLAVGGAFFVLRPGDSSVGGPAPSATPTAAPATSAPATSAPPGDQPMFPESPLPEPSGEPLSADLIGRTYRTDPADIQNGRQLVLTLRGADDPHCTAMYDGSSTCFTVLWSPFKDDPGARGSARIVGGSLVLGFALVPFDLGCVGSSATYAIEDAGATLRGVDPPACTFQGFVALP